MKKAFQLPSAGSSALIILGSIDFLVLALAAWFVARWGEDPTRSAVGLLFTLPLAGLFGWLLLKQARSTVELTDDALVLNVPWYGKSIPLKALKTDGIRVLDDSDMEPWRLRWRTNGIGFPGYQVGWFTTRSGDKVLAAKTNTAPVLVPTTKGYSLLLSVHNAEEFVGHLRGTVS